MKGLMQEHPLSLTHFFDRAEQLFPEKKVVTATASGRERTTYGDWAGAHRGGSVACSTTLGISADGRVATFGWNTARHLELYFAAPCTGRVLHTLNIRLFPEQLTYIANHAEDEVVFVDRSLTKLLWPLLETFKTVRHVVVMDDGTGDQPDAAAPGQELHDYETLLAAADPVEFGIEDENQAASMCYTSGTTGNPKGVVYSHRSTWLHTMACHDDRRPRRPRERRDPPGRADVPRQRLGPRPRRGGLRRVARDARPRPVPEGDRHAHRGGEGHRRGRRPDHLDGRAARARRAGTRQRSGPSRAAARPCRGRCRRPTARRPACRSCRPGA